MTSPEPSAAPWERTAAWLVAVWAGCLAGLVLVYELTVRTVAGRIVGDVALRGADVQVPAFLSGMNTVLDLVTATSIAGAVALVAVVALARDRRDDGLVAVGLLVAANVSSRLLKSFLLSRPDLGLSESAPVTLNSLPSGHTTAAFSAVVALLVVLPRRLRTPVALVGIGFSALAAIATMTSGWHRAGDSLASLLLVASWTAVAGLVLLLRRAPRDDDAHAPAPEPTPAVHPDGATAVTPDAAPADRRGAPPPTTRAPEPLEQSPPGAADDAPSGQVPPVPPVGRTARRLLVGSGVLAAVALAIPLGIVLDEGARSSTFGATAVFVAAGLLLVAATTATTVLVLRVLERTDDPAPARDPQPAEG
ncbi:MAG: phosphatase PAP2 family protein [Frankiales bacterium]|nr:phosphatase PAP2 family protein [Frankiales bacterium]